MTGVVAPDLFLIALAAPELLADTAARSPLLLIVEDAQWLDRPSCDVLAFVARRLASEPMVLLAAVREGHGKVSRSPPDREAMSAVAAAQRADPEP
jgi:hypothetical protein